MNSEKHCKVCVAMGYSTEKKVVLHLLSCDPFHSSNSSVVSLLYNLMTIHQQCGGKYSLITALFQVEIYL